MSEAILVLEDGRCFHGQAYGAIGESFGEAVFATGMSGYQETLTDPSYCGQVVIATAPHIGNTGWNDEDDESGKIWVAGYVVRDPARRPSNWRANRSLDDVLRSQEIVGISGIDTRALTRHLRDNGVMRVGISSLSTDTDQLLAKVRAHPVMAGSNLIDKVSTQAPYTVSPSGPVNYRIAALDLGIKSTTSKQFAARGVQVELLPASTNFEQIQQLNPDGFFISNGPGDPATADHAVELTKQVLATDIPIFGICFGNQILGRALGFDTYKLKYGHRGINQPVLDRINNRIDITCHNHGFAIDVPTQGTVDTEYGQVSVSHICLNDDVVEGIELRQNGNLRAFSVQYHPEAAAGPHDAEHLFDRFLKLMAQRRNS